MAVRNGNPTSSSETGGKARTGSLLAADPSRCQITTLRPVGGPSRQPFNGANEETREQVGALRRDSRRTCMLD